MMPSCFLKITRSLAAISCQLLIQFDRKKRHLFNKLIELIEIIKQTSHIKLFHIRMYRSFHLNLLRITCCNGREINEYWSKNCL